MDFGWFNTANEVGAIIAIIMPILFDNIIKKIEIKKLALLAIVIFASFKIGTRIPLVAFLVCIFIYGIKYLISLVKTKDKRKIIIIFSIIALLLIALIVVIPFTPIYKNIIIHTEFLGITKPIDIFRDLKTIDHFIFSERLSFLSNTWSAYKDAEIVEKFVGIGYNQTNKTIEMDIFDILFGHGIIGTIVYFGAIIFVLRFYKPKYELKYIISIGLSIFVSTLAGHVFTAPAVSIVVCTILLKGEIDENRNSNIKLQ